MIETIAQQATSKWWTFLVRGLIALALGVFVFMEPSTAVVGLIYFVAAYFIVNGCMALVGGVSLTGFSGAPLLVLTGLAQVALGILMIARPGVGPLALAYLVAIWAISTGLLELSAGIAFRNVIENGAWWIVLGILTLALGVYIIFRPDLGVIALVYAVGIYAVLAACVLFALAFNLRSAGSKLQSLSQADSTATTGAH